MLSPRILCLAFLLPLLTAGRAAADCSVDETATPAINAEEARQWVANTQFLPLSSASKQGMCRIERGLAPGGPPCQGAAADGQSITVRNLITNRVSRVYPDLVDGRNCTVRQTH